MSTFANLDLNKLVFFHLGNFYLFNIYFITTPLRDDCKLLKNWFFKIEICSKNASKQKNWDEPGFLATPQRYNDAWGVMMQTTGSHFVVFPKTPSSCYLLHRDNRQSLLKQSNC